MVSSHKLFCALFLAVFLAACVHDDGSVNRRDVGMIAGAAGGAVAGNAIGGDNQTARVLGIITGALVGGAVGGYLGSRWDNYDRMQAALAMDVNPDQQAAIWRNPNNNAQSQFTPTRTFYQNNNTPCRDFTTTVTIDGRQETGRGTACRQPDGSWRITQ